MTLVYELGSAERSAQFRPDATHQELYEWFERYQVADQPRRHIQHMSLWPHWREFEGELDMGNIDTGRAEPIRKNDFGSSALHGLKIISANAVEKTEGLWGMAEILPLKCRGGDYSIMHPTVHHDILNMDASTYAAGKRFETKLAFGTLSSIYVYEFDVSRLNKIELFRLPQNTSTYCTQGFVDKLTEIGLTGWRASQVFPPTESQLEVEARHLHNHADPEQARKLFGQKYDPNGIHFGNRDLRTKAAALSEKHDLTNARSVSGPDDGMTGSRVNVLKWDDYPPSAALGEPWQLAEGESIEHIVEMYRRQLGDDTSTSAAYSSTYVLNMIERHDQLLELFDGVPGSDLVLPRLHQFMQIRHRTPQQRLTPTEAVKLADDHMAEFANAAHRWLDRASKARGLPDEERRLTAIQAVETFRERLLNLDIRWVDGASATTNAVEFDGVSVSESWRSTDDLAFSKAELSGTSGLVQRASMLISPLASNLGLRSALGETGSKFDPEVWHGLTNLIRGLSKQYELLLCHILAPVITNSFDGEPFYRLWEGGASMWIGTDAIEVRTDWAQRWPNSRYLD